MASSTEQTGRARNPDAVLERLSHVCARLAQRHGLARCELFHRGSDTVRVTRRGGRNEIAVGHEDGVAARLQRDDRSATAFATGSGHDEHACARVTACALEATGASMGVAAHWAAHGEPLVDHDESLERPSPDKLAAWLETAVRSFVERRADGNEDAIEQAWVEAAATVETWAVDGRPVASRTRARGWAYLRRAPDGSHADRRPLLTAAVRWSELDADHWVCIDEQRDAIGSPGSGTEGERVSVVFAPEASAHLISVLVRSLIANGSPSGLAVGTGLRVWDAADDRAALFGGRFDDSGFPTRRLLLADGSRLREPLTGTGHDRRPSFRDPPAPMPSNLVVDPPRVDPPDAAFHVTRLAIQPLGADRWVLDVGGCRGGQRVSQAFVPVDPHALARACIGGYGEPRTSHRGVTTPFLVFDALPVRY